MASLVERGILRHEDKRLFQETVRHLWGFRSPRYFMVDGKAKQETRVRFTDILFSHEFPDPQDIARICLVDTCGILQTLFDENEMERITPRIEQLRQVDLIGREITNAIADIERSIGCGSGMENLSH